MLKQYQSAIKAGRRHRRRSATAEPGLTHMKICLVLQRQFAYVGHALARELKDRGVDEFCGYVYKRSGLSFLQKQSDLRYSTLLLDEDSHAHYRHEPIDWTYLKRLEREYGQPNLSPYFELDRVIRRGQLVREYPYEKPPYQYEDMLRILQVKSRAILAFLDKERPDAVILSVIADLSTLFLYHAAKKKGIRVFFLESSRVRNLHTLTEEYQNFSFVNRTYERLLADHSALPDARKQAEIFLHAFRNRPVTHSHQDTPTARPLSRGKQFGFLMPTGLIRSFSFVLRLWFTYMRNPHRNDPYETKPWHYLLDRIKRKLRVLRGFDDLYETPAFSEPYVFFPLQLEPEMATSLFSKFYTDQLWLIKQTAKSLPVDFRLYVKEHPAMYGYRTRRFYEEIAKIPNVKLLSPTLYGSDVVANARLVLTLTGTSGWEAMLLKKPVITFGDVFYNTLPMAQKCGYINDLPRLVQKQLDEFRHDEEKLLTYLAAIFAESANFNLIQMWDIEHGLNLKAHEKELKDMAALIWRHLTTTL